MASGSKVILLDIEGTTSSISYVFQILYPYAKEAMPEFLQRRFSDPAVKDACEKLAQDVGEPGLESFGKDEETVRARVIEETTRLVDNDVKATGLKALQGLIWAEGYAKGDLKSHVFDDVPCAIKSWSDAGFDIRIFSSGSIAAQKVFFKYTESGDLCKYITDHYDTTTGPKKDSLSYKMIAESCAVKPSQVVFLSDVVDELDAAKEAGMTTVLVNRPGNNEQPENHRHQTVTSFDQLKFSLPV